MHLKYYRVSSIQHPTSHFVYLFRFPHFFSLLLLFTFYFLPFTFQLSAQTVYEPLQRDVYDFLDRLSARGVIEYHDLITPIPRMTIAEKLADLSKNKAALTSLEQKELAFYQKDFQFELDRLNGETIANEELSYVGKDAAGRWRLFSYRDKYFSLNLSPIYGQQIGKNDGERQTHTWNGASVYGYLRQNLGFSFDFRDNREEGDNIDVDKAFSPATGVDVEPNFFAKNNAIEYSETHAMLSYDWKWGRLSLGKDFLQWGYAKNGRVVLSNKAPSFPFIRLDARPTHWLRFNYFHAWLASDVIDSTRIFPTLREGVNSFGFRDKFLASHTITITPKRGLDVSIGESIIYSDQLEIAYLMPIMFFRLADHYLSDRLNEAGSNAQLFFSVSSRNHIPNTHLYGTLLIDDISLSDVFNDERQVNHLGGTIGAMVSNLPFPNLTLRGEYSRINPFVYKHFIPTLLYNSSSYPLGHWIGNNGDVLYGSVNYRMLRGLQANLWAQYIRKGGEGEVADQYTIPHKPFLFDPRTNYTQWGVEVKYEISHELFARGRFQFNRVSEAQNGGDFRDTDRREFFIALFYGL